MKKYLEGIIFTVIILVFVYAGISTLWKGFTYEPSPHDPKQVEYYDYLHGG